MLTEPERRVVRSLCYDHTVAHCVDCDRDYRPDGIGADLWLRLEDFCPLCRSDLTDSIRGHLLMCPVIAAALGETIARGEQHIKESRHQIASATLLAAESRARVERILRRRAP